MAVGIDDAGQNIVAACIDNPSGMMLGCRGCDLSNAAIVDQNIGCCNRMTVHYPPIDDGNIDFFRDHLDLQQFTQNAGNDGTGHDDRGIAKRPHFYTQLPVKPHTIKYDEIAALIPEALAGGLVRSVHPQAELMDVARGFAREIADNTSAVSVSMTRAMMWRLPSGDHPMDAHRIDSRAIYRLSRGKDAAEGIASFLEKREPNYPGKVSEDMPDFYPWWEEPEYK